MRYRGTLFHGHAESFEKGSALVSSLDPKREASGRGAISCLYAASCSHSQEPVTHSQLTVLDSVCVSVSVCRNCFSPTRVSPRKDVCMTDLGFYFPVWL